MSKQTVEPILTMFEVHGDPDEIFALHREKIAPEAARAAGENGGISNTVARTENGVLIVNLWESEEGMRKASERIRPIAQEAGIGEQVGWRQYEVLVHRTPD